VNEVEALNHNAALSDGAGGALWLPILAGEAIFCLFTA
jgi:hypothetical protein